MSDPAPEGQVYKCKDCGAWAKTPEEIPGCCDHQVDLVPDPALAQPPAE